jgi:hypothetical protein
MTFANVKLIIPLIYKFQRYIAYVKDGVKVVFEDDELGKKLLAILVSFKKLI